LSWIWTNEAPWSLATCAWLCLWAPAAGADPAAVAGQSPRMAAAGRVSLSRALGAGKAAGSDSRLELRAARMDYLPAPSCEGRCPAKVELSGAVVLRLEGLELRAARVELALDGAGHPTRVLAAGGARVTQRGRVGRARRMELVLESRRIALIGDAVLHTRGLSLRGDRVELELPSGRLVVHNARVQMGRMARGSGP